MSTHRTPPLEPTKQRARRLGVLLLLVVATVIGCRDEAPTGPRARPDTVERPRGQGSLNDSGFVFSNRAHAILPSQHRLRSTTDELDRGVLRYELGESPVPSLGPDDFVIAEMHGERVVRRVLAAETSEGTLRLETGPGYWSDIVRSGVHRVTVPFDKGGDGIVTDAGIMLDPVDLELPGVPIPDLSVSKSEIDLCALMNELTGVIGGVCGSPKSQSISYGAELEIEGQLDSLILKDVTLGVAGSMDLAVEVDGGGLVGGAPPSFYPCNLRAYLGCLTTPSGAAFITWLRQYAPNVPDASLPPVRVCVPGLPVRTRAGYWDRSGWIPRWVPPVFVTCRVANVGVLPTVVLPSAGSAAVVAQPRVTGGMTVRAVGDVKLSLKIPIGPTGISVGKGGERLSAKGTIGFFILISLEVRNTAVEARLDFDNESRIIQQWDSDDGWNGNVENVQTSFDGNLVDIGPDTIALRLATLAEITGKLCAGVAGCDPNDDEDSDSTAAIRAVSAEDAALLDGLNVGVKATASYIKFIDAIRTQEPLGPPDSNFVIGKVAIERGKEIPVGASVEIPFENFFNPPVPLSWDTTFATVRLPMATSWEEGGFVAQTVTTGANLDPDGYRLVVERTDTLPRLFFDGAVRIGAARDHGKPIELEVESNGNTGKTPGSYLGCTVAYTDIFKPYVGQIGKPLDGSRLLGEALPVWFVAFPCQTLAAHYRFTLEDVADNCTVLGGNAQEHWITGWQPLEGRSGVTELQFDVECSGDTPTGSVEITTNLSDSEFDPLPYLIKINGAARGPIAGNATRVITGVAAGTAQVVLAGGSGLCDIPDTVEVNVVANATATVAYSGPCLLQDEPPPPAGTVTVEPLVTGDSTDGNGFLAVLDGEAVEHVAISGIGQFSDVPGGRPTVLTLTDVDPACRPITPLPITFDLGTPTGIALLQPQLECSTAPVRALTGRIERASAGMVGIALRLETGALQSLTGSLTSELTQLEGSNVSVWGTDAGLALTVHGYELVSTLSAPRATGVLLERDGAFWLLGRDAHLLNGPPSALQALVGDYVWVGGAMPSDSTMTPSVFGLLRSNP